MAWLAHHLALVMFGVLGVALFCGFPVGFVLGGVGILFGVLGIALDIFMPIQFFNLLPRIWGGVASNPVLVAIPMFIFMGTVLERSGIAHDLLHCLQVLTRRVPGGLAMSVTVMGTIMAATTGIVGASVIMLTLIAMPAMLERGYKGELAAGTIASAGTLGILIPPSIMLVVMGDLLTVSVGALFAAALIPGLVLSGLYLGYIGTLSALRPQFAPALPADIGPHGFGEFAAMVLKSFFPPIFLVVLVLGSIFGGWATPTEAAGVGSFGALLLAAFRRRLNSGTLHEIIESAGLTNAMVFLLGFFFDWIEISLIVLPVFGPLLAGLDFADHIGSGSPVVFMSWFVVLLAVNLQTSFLTPPFGFTLFCMRGILPAPLDMMHLYRGIIPFVVLQLIGMALILLFPDLALWLPRATGFLN